jgi:hypothetical protein
MIQKSRSSKIERNKNKRKLAAIRRKIRFGKLSPAERSIYRDKRKKSWNYDTVEVPSIFSLVENTIEVLGFIDSLEHNLRNKKETFVEMNKVTYIDNGAVIVLLSILRRFKNFSIKFNGDFPKDGLIRSKLERSGFFDQLYDRKPYDQIGGINDIIFSTTNTIVDGSLAAFVIGLATTTVFGSPKRSKGMYRVLIELMHNTNNHAAGKDQLEENRWYLSLDHNYDDNVVSISFIDYGVGIFTSLDLKDPSSKFYNWLPKLLRSHSYSNNAELLKLILKGEFHATVTNQDFRGKGLPGIYEAAQRDHIQSLQIVTNDVYASANQDEYQNLPVSFNGTYIYFEISKNQPFLSWIEQ